MSKKGLELFKVGKHEGAFKKFTLYLKNTKKKLDKGYYETHKMIDTILESITLSDKTLKWLKKIDSDEVHTIIAKIHYFNKDYKEAVKSLKVSNTHMSHYLLGNMYSNGVGVDKDNVKAGELFKISATMGNMYAQYTMGNLYKIKGDLKNAKKYYKLSSDQKYDKAQYTLGIMIDGSYYNSPGRQLISESAIQGNKDALEACLGEHVYKYNVKVIKYYEKILLDKADDLEIVKILCKLYQHNLDLNTYGNVAMSARTRLIVLYPRLEQNAEVLYNLGQIYVTQNITQAHQYLTKAMDLGSVKAQSCVGRLNTTNYGIPNSNFAYGLDLLEKAASKNDVKALSKLGSLYAFGQRKDGQVVQSPYSALSTIEVIFEPNLDRAKDLLKRCQELCVDHIHRRYREANGEAVYALSFISQLEKRTTVTLTRVQSKSFTDVTDKLCEHISYGTSYKIKETLMDNPEFLKDMCKSVYKMVELDRSNILTLSRLFRDIKKSVEKGTDMQLYLGDPDNLVFVKFYLQYRNDTMRKTLNTTSLHVKVLNDIIESYCMSISL